MGAELWLKLEDIQRTGSFKIRGAYAKLHRLAQGHPGAGVVPQLAGKKVVLLLSGGNLDSILLGRIIDQGLARPGRIFRFSVVLPDRPGALADLLNQVAAVQANVLHISHGRLGKDLPPRQTRVRLEIETRGFAHADELAQLLSESGYGIEPE